MRSRRRFLALTQLLVAVIAAVAIHLVSARPAVSQPSPPSGPPSVPMTIPLPDPLFWDPATATGDYAVVEQTSGLFLLRPATGLVMARLRSAQTGGQPLGSGAPRDAAAGSRALPSPTGWPFRPGDQIPAAPVVEDIEGDGSPEVIFVTREGWVWVVNPDGLPPAGWPVRLGTPCYAGVALADLDGDGLPEIIVGDGLGRVHAFRRDGSYLPGWPSRIPGDPELPAIHGSVAAADLRGDGQMEVVVTQAAGRVCVFDADGHVARGWPVSTQPAEDPTNAGTIFAGPALGSLDGSGVRDVIVGANDYRVYAWTPDGRLLPGWPRLLDNKGRAGYAEPVLADLDGSGHPDVLIATDRGFSGPPRIYALDARGRDVKGWPADLPERCNAGVAAGDLDHNGEIEVVAATGGEPSWIQIFSADGQPRRGFPIGLAEMSVNASPVLADVDGDGKPEILVAAMRARFDPMAVVLAFNARGDMVKPFPIRLEGCEVVTGGPCVADMMGDGHLELLLGTEVQGQLYAWDLAAGADGRNAPWPRPGFDNANTGLYRPPGPRKTPEVRRQPPSQEETQAGPVASPYSPLQTVSFVLVGEGHVRLCVTDVQRQTIRTLLDTVLPPGAYSIAWDGFDGSGRPAAAGVYFYDLEIPGRRRTGQLLLIR